MDGDIIYKEMAQEAKSRSSRSRSELSLGIGFGITSRHPDSCAKYELESTDLGLRGEAQG